MINRILLVGNIVRKPEFKALPSGHSIAEFTLAQSEKTKKGDKAYFFNCVVFGKSAEFISQYGDKGRKVYIEGSYKPESYTNKDGQKAYSHKIQVSEFQFLDFKKDDTSFENVAREVSQQNYATQAPFVVNTNSNFNDDSIPF